MRKTLEFFLAGNNVARFHTTPTHTRQTVGHHSAGVALLVMQLTGGKASSNLYVAALLHDLPECRTGDIPAPTKRLVPEIGVACAALEEEAYRDCGVPYPVLTRAEEHALRLADALDGMMACIHERRLGNQNMRELYWKWRGYVDELGTSGIEKTILNALVEMWMEADKR